MTCSVLDSEIDHARVLIEASQTAAITEEDRSRCRLITALTLSLSDKTGHDAPFRRPAAGVRFAHGRTRLGLAKSSRQLICATRI
jgi:hypothetical protein